MNKTILVLSTQYPGYGGAGTNAYAIIKYLRKNNYNTIGIFFEDNIHVNIDPDNIGYIYRFDLHPFRYKIRDKIYECKKFLDKLIKGPPSLILCKNYVAPICSKVLYPDVTNVYLISGLCNAIDICTSIPANQMILNDISLPTSEKEIIALRLSNIIVLNSSMSMKIFNNTYPDFINKLYSEYIDTSKYATILIDNNIKIIKKKYDFIIVSSILTRKEKNNVFLIEMFNNPIFDKYSKIIVGDDNTNFRNIPNSQVYDLLPHKILMNLMKESKILLYPSLYDSSPNTIREAIHNKCIVLMSNNVGFCEYFPKISVCNTYEQSDWLQKSIYLVDNYDKLIDNYNIEINIDNKSLLHLIEELI